LALVQDQRIIEEKTGEDAKSIVFWARVRGKDPNGVEKSWPLDNTEIRLMDIESGELSGRGYVREVYFTRKRVMGMIVMNPLRWNSEAPIYYEDKSDSDSE
jgi:hypothetical protein